MTPEQALLVAILLAQAVMFYLLRELPAIVAGEVLKALRRAPNGSEKP